jgi:hypothetical protein
MRPSRRSQGTVNFELWSSRGAWFWRIINLPRNRGIIGAAATEAEAKREASATIEELLGPTPHWTPSA